MAKRRETRATDEDGSSDYGRDEIGSDGDAGVNRTRSRRVVSYREDDDEEEVGGDEAGGDAGINGTGDKEDKDPEDGDGIGGELDDDDEDVPTPSEDANEEDYVDDEDNDGEEVVDFSGRSRRKSRRRRTAQLSDDSAFEESLSEGSDDYVEKLKEKNFVASDDDLSDDYDYGLKKRSRKSRSRSRSVEPRKRGRLTRASSQIQNAPDSENEEDDSIQKEVDDLYDSSPQNTPVKHKLRERDSNINYTIPPPISNDVQVEALNASSVLTPYSRGRGKRANNTKNDYRRILFPTAGPFGGSDVISLFGTNIPPGGIPIPGLNADVNAGVGKNFSDSDSSEDEIAPINGEATISKNTKKPKGNDSNKLITGGSSGQGNKQKNNLSDTDPLGIQTDIDFSAVGGLDNYIHKLKEMVQLPLLYPELYQNFSITPPRGVLFHGPPGTGKTLMARALAASCSSSQRKVTFFMRKGADCLSKWVGEAERQLRLLFEEAKNQQPSIIFFDEIDGLAPVRSSKQEQIHASIVSTLLALMDGMDNRGQVIVIGATNRPDAVDPALRRPGRFDREFYFPLPDLNARKEILKINTKKWNPPIADDFLDKVAEYTKGYGGADLRALCTEAALLSIQRKYPQIYGSTDKLKVNPSKIKVTAKDFMQAMDKIVPSSARSTTTGSAPIPDHLDPLLKPSFSILQHKLGELFPDINSRDKRQTTVLDDLMYVDVTLKDSDGGFSRQKLLKDLDNSRICKPLLLVCGEPGSGQQYLSAAVLNSLEGFQVQSLDMGQMFGDSTRTPELSIVGAFIEARRHQPSVIFIPNIEIWYHVVPHSTKATFKGLLRSLKGNDKILIFGVSESSFGQLDPEIAETFGSFGSANIVNISKPTKESRRLYFQKLKHAFHMKPYEFVNDLENRPKRKIKQLKVVPPPKSDNTEVSTKKKLKQLEYDDTRLKNVLKIKLAGLMDLFKTRYKRFKKPIIDEALLYHLFDPSILQNPLSNYEVLYEKSDSSERVNMIKELATGRYYHNMDLDVIEERLWNGFYSEPKQFIKDIKMILKDSITSGDRERILKANEMFTNAQFGVDEFSTPEFLKSCKEMRAREIEKQNKVLEEHKALEENFKQQQAENIRELANANGGDLLNGNHNAANVVASNVSDEMNPSGNLNQKLGAPFGIAKNASLATDVKFEGNPQAQTAAAAAAAERRAPIAQSEPVNASQAPINQADNTLPSQQPELESSELEEEPSLDSSHQLIIGDDADTFFDTTLVNATDNYNVEKLEFVMARLMDIVWRDRSEWDKTETLQNLSRYVHKMI